MASIGNDRYLRHLLLVGQGGTITLRGILIRDIGSPLPQVLFHNRAKLNMKKKELDRIFNSKNSITDINTWDIAILSKIILQLCRRKTPDDELDNIRILKSLRNELAHSGSLTISDENEYVKQWKRVGSILTELSKNLDRSIRDECQNLIENCKAGLINRQETLHMLGNISQHDNKISEQLAILTRRVEELREQGVEEEKVIIIKKDIEDLRQVVEQYISIWHATCRTMTVLESRLTIRGDNKQLTELADELLVRVFKIASKRTQVPEDETQLTREVRQLLDEIEALEGVQKCGINEGCIQVKIVFENFRGLLKLLEFFQSDEFRNRLHRLIKAMEEIYSSQYQITFEIDKENADSIKKSIAKSTSDEIQMATAEDKLIEMRTINAHERRFETDETMLKQAPDRPAVIDGDIKSSETKLSASDSIDLENASLLDEIVELLDMGRDAEVIMLIGQSGAGKSAMLNTIHRVLTGEDYILNKPGSGHAQSVTLDLGRYDNCGVDLKTIRDVSRREKLAAVVHKLPHIVDCAGLGDEDSPELREILELFVGGFIPKKTNIEALQFNQKRYGVGCLQNVVYPNSNPADRVTKVVFLQSCRVPIPKNLIKCLNEVLKITDPKTWQTKYTAEVFLLISKYDLVCDPSVHISTGSDEDSMTLEDFVKKENELAPEFNIVGALEANRIRWASYTDRIKGRNKYIENIALKFLKRMVQPGTPQTDPTDRQEPVVGTWKTFQLYMFRLTNQIKQFFLQDMHITPFWFVTAVVFVVVIAVLYKLLMSSV